MGQNSRLDPFRLSGPDSSPSFLYKVAHSTDEQGLKIRGKFAGAKP
jgi:hypothetical protein